MMSGSLYISSPISSARMKLGMNYLYMILTGEGAITRILGQIPKGDKRAVEEAIELIRKMSTDENGKG